MDTHWKEGADEKRPYLLGVKNWSEQEKKICIKETSVKVKGNTWFVKSGFMLNDRNNNETKQKATRKTIALFF